MMLHALAEKAVYASLAVAAGPYSQTGVTGTVQAAILRQQPAHPELDILQPHAAGHVRKLTDQHLDAVPFKCLRILTGEPQLAACNWFMSVRS